jgi:putative component of membrane protein insertase Oxa1/YidC/SpoIIIJ protein YidD
MRHLFYQIYQGLNYIKHWFLIVNFGTTNYCKHKPSCSQYTFNQIEEKGLIKGLIKGFKRVLSCY